MSDQQPDPIALTDQAVEDFRQKARIVATYYLRLRHEGVEFYDALRLTFPVQRRLVFGDARRDPDDEQDA